MRKRTERLPMHELTQAGCRFWYCRLVGGIREIGTATACHIVYNKAITIANAGDSRVVLCRGNSLVRYDS